MVFLNAIAAAIVALVTVQLIATVRIFGARSPHVMATMWQLGRGGASRRVTMVATVVALVLFVSQALASHSLASAAPVVLLPLVIAAGGCIPPLMVLMGQSGDESGRLVLRFTIPIAPLRLVHMLSANSLPWAARVLALRQSLRQTATDAWGPALHDLVSLAPIAVLDARVETPHVLMEALLTVPSGGSGRKFLLVASGGEGRVFEQIRPGVLRHSGVDVLTVEQLSQWLRGIGWRTMLLGPAAYARRWDSRVGPPIDRQCVRCDATIVARFDMAIAVSRRSSLVVMRAGQPGPWSIAAWQCVRCGKTYCSTCARSEPDGTDQRKNRIVIDLKCACESLDFQPGFTEPFDQAR